LVKGTNPKTKAKFEIHRKFAHFVLLRGCFLLRFAGLYIPPLPKKGATHRYLAEMRVHFLNNFLRKISMCAYLRESKEFQVFLEFGVNTETELTMLIKSHAEFAEQRTPWHLEQLQPYFFIKGTFYDEEVATAIQEVKEFGQKARQVQTFLLKLLDFITE